MALTTVLRTNVLHCVYAPAPPGRGIKRWCCLTSVCLSCTSGLSREQRPRKTKIGTEAAQLRRDRHHFQGQKVKVTGVEAYCGGLPHSLGGLSLSIGLVVLFLLKNRFLALVLPNVNRSK